MEKPFPGSYPREQEEADNEHSQARLLGSLRIVFFGFLKVALCAYTLFLHDTAFAGAVREGKWPS